MVMVVSGGGGAGGGRREQWGLHHLHQRLRRCVLLLLLLLVGGRSKSCGDSGSSYRHQRHWLGLVGVGHRRLLFLLLLLHLLGLEVNRRGDPMCCSHRRHRRDGGQHCIARKDKYFAFVFLNTPNKIPIYR